MFQGEEPYEHIFIFASSREIFGLGLLIGLEWRKLQIRFWCKWHDAVVVYFVFVDIWFDDHKVLVKK